MAGAGEGCGSLKGIILESLHAILSPLHDTRVHGEEQIKALEVTEDFGVHLAEITVDHEGSLAIRQLASVLLKQYVEAHWCHHADKFRPPETTAEAKIRIRQLLPEGLRESISKVRSSVAYAISAIASWDWPEEWGDLFAILMQALTSGDLNAVHGAMRVLAEFCQDVTDIQMHHVAPIILPELYKIFTGVELYGIRTRTRAVHIFNTCAGMIATMEINRKGIAKDLLHPVLPQFTEALVQALQHPDGPSSDSGLKMEVIKAITTLVKGYPRIMSNWLPQILPSVWNIFTQSADFYIRTVVNNVEDADNPVDSDGEVLGFETLVYSVFDFVLTLIDSSKFRETVRKTVDQIFYYIILYMQMTEDQIRLWSNNPDQFVEDEDDDSFTFSVRLSAQDLLMSLCSEFQNDSAVALCAAVSKQLEDAEAAKTAGSQNWWKLHESIMLAVGSVSSLITEAVQQGKVQFDISGFLQSVVLVDMNSQVSPFLIGRCLWTASRYTSAMSLDMTQRFLQATVGGLHPTQPATIRISATRAVMGFCDHLKSSGNMQLLQPYLNCILDGLITIAMQFSSEVLALCMERLVVVVKVDPSFTASHESKISPLVISVFLKYCSDPFLVSVIQDLLRELASNEACSAILESRFMPTLISIFQAPHGRIQPGMMQVTLEVLSTLVRYGCKPLSEYMMTAFFAAVRCILDSDDHATLQSGGECLRAYVSVALEQVMSWQDDRGKNGLDYVIQVISKLLDPKTSEHTAVFVGRLVTVVISKAGSQLGENLDLILRAVLSKLLQAETLSVLQSLVMVFAHLVNCQLEALLDFLTSVPSPQGTPALEFVLTEWCSRQHLFYGHYERKVTTLALCKLLQYALSTNDVRLQNITVKGELLFNPNDGIRTRSKTAKDPENWTTIPVLVKIYKLLVNELSNQLENSMAKDEDEDEDEDEEDGWEEEDDSLLVKGHSLSEMLAEFADNFEGIEVEAEDEDDPDILSDPLNQVDLEGYLKEYLQTLATQPVFQVFKDHHNESEKEVLRLISIAV